MKKALCIVGGIVAMVTLAQAQVSFTANYSQDFDSLSSSTAGNPYTWTDNSTLAGWYANQGTYTVNDGSVQGPAVFSYGASSASDRALGAESTGGAIEFGIQLRNDTGVTLPTVTVNYTGEQWHQDVNNSEGLLFYYRTTSNAGDGLSAGGFSFNNQLSFYPLTFNQTGPVAVDGNSFSQTLSRTITVNWAPNEYLWLKWSLADVALAPGLSVDNFVITPEPGVYALISGLSLVGFAAYRRFNR